MPERDERQKIKEEFLKKTANAVIIQVIYPSLVLYIQQKFQTREKLTEQLFRLGEKLAETYLDDGDLINEKDFKKYILAVFRKYLMNKKVKIKEIEKDVYHIIDPICLLCAKTEIEGLDVHMCTPFSGYFQTLLNEIMDKESIGVKEFQIKTIASKWMGSPKCIHELKLVREE
ncbi:MAG: hypothetical protein ACTSRW_00260 [Candidatus Helarchaeota archaeon]